MKKQSEPLYNRFLILLYKQTRETQYVLICMKITKKKKGFCDLELIEAAQNEYFTTVKKGFESTI